MAAAQDASGTMKYWIDGLPMQGIQKGGNDPGSQKYWIDGLPERAVFPSNGQQLLLLGVGS